MNIEQLPPDLLLSQLQNRLAAINAIIFAKTNNLQKSPEGKLRVDKRGGSLRYYHVTEPGKPNGKYMPVAFGERKIRTLARRLSQKCYDLAVVEELQREADEISRFVTCYNPQRLSQIFDEMNEGVRRFAVPLQMSDEQYVERWLAVPYVGRAFSPNDPVLMTLRGERLRSKSEIIIAEVLTQMAIPYRYEFPLKMSVGRTDGQLKKAATFYPDFTCLNIRTRQEFIWEHFGLMDDASYARNAMEKLDVYESNGIYFGDRLIFTKEFSDKPLDVNQVQRLAEKFLL